VNEPCTNKLRKLGVLSQEPGSTLRVEKLVLRGLSHGCEAACRKVQLPGFLLSESLSVGRARGFSSKDEVFVCFMEFETRKLGGKRDRKREVG
jgi:hypothetical protein